MEFISSRLALQSGEVYNGLSPIGQTGPYFGEVVFTTGMTGYVESLTDPSYKGQILVFTYPLIGNYGLPDRIHWESDKIQASGVIINELGLFSDHHQATSSFLDWLLAQNIPLMVNVDTRSLTKLLRTYGVALGTIVREKQEVKNFFNPNDTCLSAQVTVSEPREYGSGTKKIIAVDCGMKENILRHLLELPIKVKRVPYDYDFNHEDFDGVFISNGPGDPALCVATIEILRKAMDRKKPVFGICLGAQLMALTTGAKTYKLRYGHRGHNQPCLHEETQRCYLTSQNHGYAIDEATLPKEWKVSFRNLNDRSVEGIEHIADPFFAVQFHPEAAPGPVDTRWLFEKFFESL